MHDRVVILDHPVDGERGAATMAVILVVMLVVTVLSLSAFQVSNVELRMAGNEAERLAGVETAQSSSEAITANRENFVIYGGRCYLRCTANGNNLYDTRPACDETTLALPNPPFTEETGVWVRLEATGLPPPRSTGTSASSYSVTLFDVFSHYLPSHARGSEAHVRRGVMVLAPAGGGMLSSGGGVTGPCP